MSTVTSVIARKKACVIIRGFDGKPGKLTVVGIRGGVVDACRQDEVLSMGYRADHVFKFDAKLFNKLTKAFGLGNCKELERLWEIAVPFDISGGDSDEGARNRIKRAGPLISLCWA